MTDLEKLLEPEVATFNNKLSLEQKCMISVAISFRKFVKMLEDHEKRMKE